MLSENNDKAVVKISLTVNKALHIGAFKECTLLAGDAGLTRDVSYISSMEVPNVKTWAVNKQLLITTAYAIRNSPEQLADIIKELSDAGASGLGLKTKFIGEIPAAIIKLANEYQMPLIQIPEHILFVDLIVPIMKAIINEQNIKLEFSEKIYTKLIELNLTEGGLPNITDFVYNSINIPTAIVDHLFSLRSSSAPKDPQRYFNTFIEHHLTELEHFSWNKQLLTTFHSQDGFDYTLRKIIIKNRICGFIVLCTEKTLLDEASLIVVEHAATAAALEFSKAQALQKQIKLMENSFYLDLISENVNSEEEAFQRASSLSWPKLPITLIVFNIDCFEQITKTQDEEEIFQIKDNIRQIIKNCFASAGKHIPIVLNSDSFACILSGKYTVETLSEILKSTLQKVFQKTRLQLTAGICGNIKSYIQLKAADKDALESIYICRRENRIEKYIFAEDIKLEKALLTVANNPKIRDFTDSTIGLLLKYDEKNHTQLTHTLAELIKCMGVRAETAKNLYIHRNTLTQRLKKIETITGYDLGRSNDLLAMGIAIKMQKYLD